MAARLTVYTAQDVARFCEVDLKTIHHWADAGKIAHHRTEGRHLRFRRNDVLRFLRAHAYPIADALTTVKPVVSLSFPDEGSRRLSARFAVRAYERAVVAIASIFADEPDAIVFGPNDPTWTPASLAALRAHRDTAWPFFVVVGDPVPEADLVLPDTSKLSAELARKLAVD